MEHPIDHAMWMRSTSVLIVVLVAGLQGCYYDNEEELYPGSGFCDLSNVTWSGTVKPIMETRCATPGCHVPGGTGPGDFNQYTEVKARVDNGKFQQFVFDARTMPPGGMPSCELKKLQNWVAAGAPNN